MAYCKNALIICIIFLFTACTQNKTQLTIVEEPIRKIEMVTDHGTMIIKLYNETPLHRDNFINLAINKAFDSLLFHRVINTFMIQGGDPDSRKAKPNDTLGEGDAPYVVKAEFNTELFHKKGVLAAARDDHPERSSSAMQFYLVQGKVLTDSMLLKTEDFMNKNFAQRFFQENNREKPLRDSIKAAIEQENRERYNILSDSILALAKSDGNFKLYTIPENQRKVYKSIGGTPHLDQNYTVFGEVVKGIEVIDSIANVKTDSRNRPLNDVRIWNVNLVE